MRSTNDIPLDQVDKYHVTGIDRAGKRFKLIYSNYKTACMINLWQGTVWAVLKTGKRKILNRV